MFRRYLSRVNTEVKIQGVSELSSKAVVNSVGVRGGRWLKNLPVRPALVPAFEASVRTSDMKMGDFVGAAKKYISAATDFTHFDLAAIVECMTAGIATYASYGQLNSTMLCGGNEINLTALGHAAASVVASCYSGFIPRALNSNVVNNIFEALVYAATGCGATIVMDMMQLGPDNCPVMATLTDAALVAGCYQALRLIGGQYQQAGAGDVFAYAMARGLHQVVTVGGHSDEGGLMRSVFRKGGFKVSYGGITTMSVAYMGLPRPAVESVAGWQNWVDRIVLSTTALCAVSDPCVVVDGIVFPSVFADRGAQVVAAGTHTEASLATRTELMGMVCRSARLFCDNYATALCKLFNIKGVSG